LRRALMIGVLFLCTGNSARSILAEALLRRIGGGRFRAYSAGSHPKGAVNPFALELLQGKGFDTAALRSKAWDEFAGPDAPRLDVIITVCDEAAGETCPVWPGRPVTAHWGQPDPAAAAGDDNAKRTAFEEAFRILSDRIGAFCALTLESLDAAERRARIAAIAGR